MCSWAERHCSLGEKVAACLGVGAIGMGGVGCVGAGIVGVVGIRLASLDAELVE